MNIRHIRYFVQYSPVLRILFNYSLLCWVLLDGNGYLVEIWQGLKDVLFARSGHYYSLTFYYLPKWVETECCLSQKNLFHFSPSVRLSSQLRKKVSIVLVTHTTFFSYYCITISPSQHNVSHYELQQCVIHILQQIQQSIQSAYWTRY